MIKFDIPFSYSVLAAEIPAMPAPKIKTSASAFSHDWQCTRVATARISKTVLYIVDVAIGLAGRRNNIEDARY